MNHTATTDDPYAVSLWPDTSTSGEEMIMWAQAAGYAQQGLTSDNFSFDTLDAAVWGQSATLPAAPFGLQNISLDTDWTSNGTFPVVDMLGNRASLADATTVIDTMAFAPAAAPPFPTDGMNAFTQDFLFSQSDFSDLFSSTTPSLTDMGSVPSPQSDGTRDELIPFPVLEEASSYSTQPPGSSIPQVDIAGTLQPNHFTCTPSWLVGEPDYLPLDLMSMNNNMSYSTQSDYTRAHDHITAPTEALTTVVTGEMMPMSALGKRSRKRYETYRYGLPQAGDQISKGNGFSSQKRARPEATRVPEGAKSAKRTPRPPATRTQQTINSKSKAAGRGAGRLASMTARGVYHRSFPGLSVSQGSVGALEKGQPSWIEEREVETWQDAGSSASQPTAQRCSEIAEVEEELYAIPGNLSMRHRLMLQMTQADEERGAVRVIKCKLCPAVRLGSWEPYKRHCKSCEKHPSELKFCPRCGDYFGRRDSGIRHKDRKYQEACLNTPQDEAREKKQKVERLLKEFDARLEHCLRNGKELGPRFADIVNKDLTNTSKKKKVSKQEETSSWATGP